MSSAATTRTNPGAGISSRQEEDDDAGGGAAAAFDASSRRFEFNCMKCYQPLVLDQSILDVTTAEIDEMQATLAESSLDPSSSHQMPNSGSFLSSADKFNRLPAPESSKQAYLRALRRDPLPPAVVPDSTTLTTETEGGFQRRRSGVASSPGGGPVAAGGAKRGKAGGAGAPSSGPGESYVLLPPPAKQPSLRPSASSTGGQVRSRERTDSSLAAAATTSATPSLARQADDAPSSLFNTLSSHTSIDHPLCEECARGLEQQFIRAREDAILERQAYERWEELVAIGIPGDPSGMGPLSVEEDQESREEEKRMKEELEAMTRDLEILEKEEARLKEDEKTLRQEEVEVEEEEKRFLLDRQRVQTELREARDRVRTERVRNALAAQTLSRLESTDVYSEVFRIGHAPLLAPSASTAGGASSSHAASAGTGNASIDGPTGSDALPAIAAGAAADARAEAPLVGTINGLRLGGRPIVDWAEINAALGMVALCIDRIAVKVGCSFERYKIVPLGSYSRVDELPPSKNSYELYASTDISPSRLLQNRRFNYALGGLLDCLKQLVEYGTKHDRGWAGGGLEIQKDRIGGNSIKLASSMGMSSIGLGGASSVSSEAEQSWTRALRAVLAVLKRILVIEAEVGRDVPRK